jgi:hypothetical protein
MEGETANRKTEEWKELNEKGSGDEDDQKRGRLGTIRDDSGRFGTIRDDSGRFGTIRDDSGRLGTTRDEGRQEKGKTGGKMGESTGESGADKIESEGRAKTTRGVWKRKQQGRN